jgi:glycosyltransferase involved in cell wall biosynthesis
LPPSTTEKGYGYSIKALALLLDEGIDARLIIIGEGYERDYLEGLVARFKLTDRVILPGYREDAKKYLPYFNVFVISSLTEGLPVTLLKAMQAGVPIVSTRVGDVPEVLDNGKAGILVDTPSSQDLADAIKKLISFPELGERMAEKAKTIVKQNYSSQNMATQYLNIYRAVPSRRSMPRRGTTKSSGVARSIPHG